MKKLGFGEMASLLGIERNPSAKRWRLCSRQERAKRALVHFLSFQPPRAYLGLWSKTIIRTEKVKGHLRCPEYFLRKLERAILDSPLPPCVSTSSPTGLGTWILAIPSPRARCPR
jgi:hypothetical protein